MVGARGSAPPRPTPLLPHRSHQPAAPCPALLTSCAADTLNGPPPRSITPDTPQHSERFPPVLHHFFLERFHQPAAWFAARTTYTRRWGRGCGWGRGGCPGSRVACGSHNTTYTRRWGRGGGGERGCGGGFLWGKGASTTERCASWAGPCRLQRAGIVGLQGTAVEAETAEAGPRQKNNTVHLNMRAPRVCSSHSIRHPFRFLALPRAAWASHPWRAG